MMRLDTLFLDRDGVLNKKIENGYVLSTDEIIICPGVSGFLASVKPHFKHIIVVTNQRCVGRGLLSTEGLDRINQEISRLTGTLIHKFYICPHLDEDHCDCRKPKTGLFLQAQKDFGIDFERSWMIGDSESDIEPAKTLGMFTLFRSEKPSIYADLNFESFNQLGPVVEGLSV